MTHYIITQKAITDWNEMSEALTTIDELLGIPLTTITGSDNISENNRYIIHLCSNFPEHLKGQLMKLEDLQQVFDNPEEIENLLELGLIELHHEPNLKHIDHGLLDVIADLSAHTIFDQDKTVELITSMLDQDLISQEIKVILINTKLDYRYRRGILLHILELI